MTEGVSLWDQFAALLASPMTQRSLLAALIVGVAAPVIGTYLVQRRLSLLGDGIVHVALTGVALGWLVGAATGATDLEAYAVPGAMIAAVAGAIMIEVVRGRGQTSGDVALALLDRKSTRLNSSHVAISYAVFCLKKKSHMKT